MGAVIQLDQYRDAPAQQPRVRARLDWRPRDIQDALHAADGGSLQMAAELCERLMCDPQIAGVLSTRTLGMLGLPLAFEGDSRMVAALAGDTGADSDADGDWHTLHPQSESAQIVAWGIVLGVGLGQRVPLPRRPGARLVHRLRAWHPRDLRWEDLPLDDERRMRGQSVRWLVRSADGREREVVPGDGEWVLYAPHGTQRPWALAAWRALAFAWILKQFALLDRARQVEVHGGPVRVGIAAEGATEEGRARWRDQLRTLSRDSALVLPHGYDMRMIEATGTGWELFESQIAWADRAIAIVLAGQTVTTEGSRGFADGATQDTIRRELTRFTSQTWASCLRSQSLRPWALANYGTPTAPLPRWDAESSEERLARARSMISLGEAVARLDAALAASGKRMDMDVIAQRYDLPVLDLPQGTRAPTITLAPTDLAKVVRVNEARASAGLGALALPDGSADPDGWLTVSEFAAKTGATADIAVAEAEGDADDAGDGSESARATQEREAQQAVAP